MTLSELATIITAGMATIASTTLALYVMLLQSQMPTIAGHLISASIIAAPASIVMAKLVIPETGKPATLGLDVKPFVEREDNLIMAIINGANSGLKLLGGIVTLLLAFLGLLALLDLMLGWCGGLFNGWFGWQLEPVRQGHPRLVFYPFTLATGVPSADAMTIARVVGERTVATEVPAYGHLAELMARGALHDPALRPHRVLCPLRLRPFRLARHLRRRNRARWHRPVSRTCHGSAYGPSSPPPWPA